MSDTDRLDSIEQRLIVLDDTIDEFRSDFQTWCAKNSDKRAGMESRILRGITAVRNDLSAAVRGYEPGA